MLCSSAGMERLVEIAVCIIFCVCVHLGVFVCVCVPALLNESTKCTDFMRSVAYSLANELLALMCTCKHTHTHMHIRFHTQILSACHNLTHTSCNPVAHAEMRCIIEAAEKRQAWRLLDATLYVTLEPCPMCECV